MVNQICKHIVNISSKTRSNESSKNLVVNREKTVFLSTIKVIRRSRILQWRQVGLSTEVLGESVECLLGVCRTLLEVCWRVGLDDEGWGAWGPKTYEHTKGFYRLFCVDQNLVPHPSLFGRVTQSASGIEVA